MFFFFKYNKTKSVLTTDKNQIGRENMKLRNEENENGKLSIKLRLWHFYFKRLFIFL